MNLRAFKRILLQVLLVPVIALLVPAGALYWQIRGANATVSVVQQMDVSLAKITLLERLIVDEETGLRGFEITRDSRFLQPYVDAQEPLNAAFSQIIAGKGVDQQAKDSLITLQSAEQTWRESFATPVIATIQGGGGASSGGQDDVDLNLLGKRQLDSIRLEMDRITARTMERRDREVKLWRHQVRKTIWFLVVFSIILGALIGLFVRNRMHFVSLAYQGSLDALRLRAKEAFESEQRLSTTLSSIGDGVIACDAENKVELMNVVAQELTGWSAAEAKGLPLERVFRIVNETTRQTMEDPVAKVKRLNRVVGMANHTLLIRKDGHELCIDDSGAPIRNKLGRMIGVVLVFRDVTMERKSRQALLASEKLAVAGRLAATIAHEIHNPLDSVSNLLYLMQEGSTEEETKQYLLLAQQELARVTQISRAMLSLYRESKAPVPIDLKDMLEDLLMLMGPRFSNMRVTLEADLPRAITVDGFPAELRQVFTNLISNAAEAAGSGGTVGIAVVPHLMPSEESPSTQEPGATVIIADDGAGIPDDVKDRLFEPFFTTKGERGTGLGLWVSRGIIKKHGGTIRIESSTQPENHGTVVSVFLASKPTMHPGGD